MDWSLFDQVFYRPSNGFILHSCLYTLFIIDLSIDLWLAIMLALLHIDLYFGELFAAQLSFQFRLYAQGYVQSETTRWCGWHPYYFK